MTTLYLIPTRTLYYVPECFPSPLLLSELGNPFLSPHIPYLVFSPDH